MTNHFEIQGINQGKCSVHIKVRRSIVLRDDRLPCLINRWGQIDDNTNRRIRVAWDTMPGKAIKIFASRAAGLITLHRPPIMDTFILNKLIAERKWTEFLNSLPVGETKVGFNEIADIKSCKAIAYDKNSDKSGRRYTFNVNKDEKSAVITVEEI